MNFYLAPMEGVTGYVYRNAYKKHFGNVDKYFTPFISPGEYKAFKSKELRDVLPENNTGGKTVVQMLTNNADSFITTARKMTEFGYEEVNLNLGCPSGTVVSKGKGAGFLAFPDKLDDFLYKVFSELTDIKVSIKTRLGKLSSDEFDELMAIYAKYPISELIIHPRIQKDMYKNKPALEKFAFALEYMKASGTGIVYNGDIFTKKDYIEFTGKFPEVDTIMLGRGIISNPGLIDYITCGKELQRETLKDFYYDLLYGYQKEIKEDRNVCFKMKELWYYMVNIFSDRDKCWKYVKKADNLLEINMAADKILKEHDIIMDKGFEMF